MGIGYAEGSIAGVDLENASGDKCKVLLLEAGNLRPTVAGSTRFAADGSTVTQYLPIIAGRAFGVRIEFIPPDVLDDIKDAINAALEAGSGFNVSLADDVNSVDEDCLPDFSQNWLTIEPQRTHEEIIKGVTFRFITSGE
jgi:hypothetical protein